MINGERTAGLASPFIPSRAGLDFKKCESAPNQAAGASPHISKTNEFKNVVYASYLDHVLFHRSSAILMAPLIREAVGWVGYECEQYITLVCDRDARPPTLKGNSDPNAMGLVILRSDLVKFKRLEDVLPPKIGLEHTLNSQSALQENRECALPATEAKNSQEKSRKGRKKLAKTNA